MYNKITLVGRWVNDPEITMSQNGVEIMRSTLAVGDSFNRDHTDFIDVTAFKKTAINTQQYTGKGSKVLVDGKLQQERWEKDGQKRSKHVVIANQIVFLDDKQSTGSNNQSNNQQSSKASNTNGNEDPFKGNGEPIDISDDDLPF